MTSGRVQSFPQVPNVRKEENTTWFFVNEVSQPGKTTLFVSQCLGPKQTPDGAARKPEIGATARDPRCACSLASATAPLGRPACTPPRPPAAPHHWQPPTRTPPNQMPPRLRTNVTGCQWLVPDERGAAEVLVPCAGWGRGGTGCSMAAGSCAARPTCFLYSAFGLAYARVHSTWFVGSGWHLRRTRSRAQLNGFFKPEPLRHRQLTSAELSSRLAKNGFFFFPRRRSAQGAGLGARPVPPHSR